MYEYKEKYTLDFSKIEHWGDFHKIIKESFDFPDYYGMNWYALWDCLTDMVDDPVHIELIGFERIQNQMPSQAKILLRILKDFKHLDHDCYKDQIRIEIIYGDTRCEIS